METNIYNKYNSFTFDDVADEIVVVDGTSNAALHFKRRPHLTEADFVSGPCK